MVRHRVLAHQLAVAVAVRRLHLDDVGAEVRQHRGRAWAGKVGGGVNDAQAIKQVGHQGRSSRMIVPSATQPSWGSTSYLSA